MRYLTTNELTELHKDEAHGILEKCAGKSVRDLFAIKVFNNYFDKSFNDRAQAKILDLGPASGAFVSQINQVGYENFYGVDVDNYLTQESRRLFKEFRTADLSWDKIPWPDDSFQAVTAWCVLPHLENPFNAIREVHRVLAHQGLFIFTAPHLTSKPSIDYFIKNRDFGSYRGTNNHLVLFTKGVLQKAVLKYFDLLGIEYHVRPKIFKRGLPGKLRKFVFELAQKVSPDWRKMLEHRWAYNAVFILRKNSLKNRKS